MTQFLPISVSEQPNITVFNQYPLIQTAAGIQQIAIGEGILKLNSDKQPLPSRTTICTILASLGLSNPEIGETLGTSALTVKNQLHKANIELPLLSRSHISRYYLQTGYYSIEKLIAPFLSAAELPVIEATSIRKTNKQIASELELSPLTVKSHLTRISQRTGWLGRELITLAAFMSQEITADKSVI